MAVRLGNVPRALHNVFETHHRQHFPIVATTADRELLSSTLSG
jgi:hypothetical protein